MSGRVKLIRRFRAPPARSPDGCWHAAATNIDEFCNRIDLVCRDPDGYLVGGWCSAAAT
jgi:hypothetical protein